MFAELGFFGLFFFLLFGHTLADYPLQNDFLAQAKNRHTDLGKLYWKHALFGHSMIHAGFVALFTGSVVLGLLELLLHAHTDYRKCEGKISINHDQFIHIAAKVLWAWIACT